MGSADDGATGESGSRPPTSPPAPPALSLTEAFGRFASPDDRYLWLRRAATLTRVVGFAAMLLGGLGMVLSMVDPKRAMLGTSGTLATVGILAFATLCTTVGHFAFAQAIDVFIRLGERSDLDRRE